MLRKVANASKTLLSDTRIWDGRLKWGMGKLNEEDVPLEGKKYLKNTFVESIIFQLIKFLY